MKSIKSLRRAKHYGEQPTHLILSEQAEKHITECDDLDIFELPTRRYSVRLADFNNIREWIDMHHSIIADSEHSAYEVLFNSEWYAEQITNAVDVCWTILPYDSKKYEAKSDYEDECIEYLKDESNWDLVDISAVEDYRYTIVLDHGEEIVKENVSAEEVNRYMEGRYRDEYRDQWIPEAFSSDNFEVDAEVMYTGGGIWVIMGKVSGYDIYFMADSGNDMLMFLSEDPRDKEDAWYDDWQEEHMLYRPVTDEEASKYILPLLNTINDRNLDFWIEEEKEILGIRPEEDPEDPVDPDGWKLSVSVSHACTMEQGNYLIDIMIDHKEGFYESYLYNRNNGIKMLMFGSPTFQGSLMNYIDMVLSNAGDYIEDYQSRYEQE